MTRVIEQMLLKAGVVAKSAKQLSSAKPVVFSTQVPTESSVIVFAYADWCHFSQDAARELLQYIKKNKSSPIRWCMVNVEQKGGNPVRVAGRSFPVDQVPTFVVQDGRAVATVNSLKEAVRKGKRVEAHGNLILDEKVSHSNEIVAHENAPVTTAHENAPVTTAMYAAMTGATQLVEWGVPTIPNASGPRWVISVIYANWCVACKNIAPKLAAWIGSGGFVQRWKPITSVHMMDSANPFTHSWIQARDGARLIGYPTVWVWDARSGKLMGELTQFDQLDSNMDRLVRDGPESTRVANENRRIHACDENGCTLIKGDEKMNGSAQRNANDGSVKPRHWNTMAIEVKINPSHANEVTQFSETVVSMLQQKGYPIIKSYDRSMPRSAEAKVRMPLPNNQQANHGSRTEHSNARANTSDAKEMVITMRDAKMAQFLYNVAKEGK